MSDDLTPPGPSRLRTLGPIALAYAVATVLTGAYFWGDSFAYAEDALAGRRLCEFGHLFWRPLGWLLARGLLPLTAHLGAADERAGVLMLLGTVCWLAGLGSVLLFRSILAEAGVRPLAADLAALGLLLSHTFLNYAQAATAYVPGLCCLLLGCYLLLRAAGRPETSARLALGAGAALAAALGFWFPYLWALPAAGLIPLLVGFDRSRLRLTVLAALACALLVALTNAAALAVQGITTVEGARAWVLRSSHGIHDVNGVPRMLFGLARSFVYLGEDGTLFRRYLARDPLNPVTLPDLLTRTRLWQIGLFYLFLAGLVVGLARSGQGRRLLALLTVAAAPTLAFAVAWQGGDKERYLPLYPFLFLALAVLLGDGRVPLPCKGIAIVFLAVTAAANCPVMARGELDRREQEWSVQAEALLPRLRPGSCLFLVYPWDEIGVLNRDYPCNPLGHRLTTDSAIPLNVRRAAQWQAVMCRRMETIWDRGGDVWVTRRLLSPFPRPEWGWVEDPSSDLRWATLHRFFAALDAEELPAAGEPFVRILPTEANRQRLARPGPAEPRALSISRRRP